MKKSLSVITALAIFVFADCSLYASTNDPFQTSPKKATKPAAAPAKAGGTEKGKNLLSKSDCLACHKVDAKVIGPAYNDVAKKYPNTKENVDLLATKVINGGSGVWGPVPMSPHAAVSMADAREMVKYILSLKAK